MLHKKFYISFLSLDIIQRYYLRNSGWRRMAPTVQKIELIKLSGLSGSLFQFSHQKSCKSNTFPSLRTFFEQHCLGSLLLEGMQKGCCRIRTGKLEKIRPKGLFIIYGGGLLLLATWSIGAWWLGLKGEYDLRGAFFTYHNTMRVFDCVFPRDSGLTVNACVFL